jgi:tetratricopeptide (TPR) repeat protein
MVRRSREQLGSALQAYVDLLLKLHQLIVQGKGDSEDSDALRDHMDVYWSRFDDGELKIARQLSADLYTIHNENENLRANADFYSAELAAEMGKAHDSKDFLRALELLAERTDEISSGRAAILRGMSYRELGLVQAGLAFMWHSANISSDPSSAYVIALNTLWHHVDVDAAVSYSLKLLRENKITGMAHFVVASILLNAAAMNDGLLRQHYAAVSKSLLTEMLKTAPSDDARSAQAKCHEMLGNCCYLLGETSQAIKELGEAIRLNPSDDEVYVQRGLIQLDSVFQNAKSDFEKAAELGSASVWPYYYLAFDAFRSRSFIQSARLSTMALSRANDLELQAKLHELIAMSIASGSSSLSTSAIAAIRNHFRTGMILSPADQQILANSQIFEDALKSAMDQHGWVLRPPVTSQRATAVAMSQRLPELVPCVS